MFSAFTNKEEIAKELEKTEEQLLLQEEEVKEKRDDLEMRRELLKNELEKFEEKEREEKRQQEEAQKEEKTSNTKDKPQIIENVLVNPKDHVPHSSGSQQQQAAAQGEASPTTRRIAHLESTAEQMARNLQLMKEVTDNMLKAQENELEIRRVNKEAVSTTPTVSNTNINSSLEVSGKRSSENAPDTDTQTKKARVDNGKEDDSDISVVIQSNLENFKKSLDDKNLSRINIKRDYKLTLKNKCRFVDGSIALRTVSK